MVLWPTFTKAAVWIRPQRPRPGPARRADWRACEGTKGVSVDGELHRAPAAAEPKQLRFHLFYMLGFLGRHEQRLAELESQDLHLEFQAILKASMAQKISRR